MPAHFGAKLRQLREDQRLTLQELAHRLGLTSRSHIANLESGRDRPSLDLVVRAAVLFGVTTDSLLRDTVPVMDIHAASVRDISAPGVDAARLGQQVRTLRQERGLTQTALAQQLGPAGQSGIAKIERGEKLPSLERIVQLADVLGVSCDALLVPLP
ncbi:helix-turn-helix transcriptional regulator [Chloroflexales bacterium ZM16-3]|nr:helix-turn-helix transcriptional regulator [Chloroflexales bacterium ZM16-3]